MLLARTHDIIVAFLFSHARKKGEGKRGEAVVLARELCLNSHTSVSRATRDVAACAKTTMNNAGAIYIAVYKSEMHCRDIAIQRGNHP